MSYRARRSERARWSASESRGPCRARVARAQAATGDILDPEVDGNAVERACAAIPAVIARVRVKTPRGRLDRHPPSALQRERPRHFPPAPSTTRSGAGTTMRCQSPLQARPGVPSPERHPGTPRVPSLPLGRCDPRIPARRVAHQHGGVGDALPAQSPHAGITRHALPICPANAPLAGEGRQPRAGRTGRPSPWWMQ